MTNSDLRPRPPSEEDDFEMVDGNECISLSIRGRPINASIISIPLSTRSSGAIASQNETELQLHYQVVQQEEHRDILITIIPPKQPTQNIPHVPVDIVLVIDVSGSMNEDAPLPDATDRLEDAGLSVLDLTKHAARTVLENLNENDRLGIVTFSTISKIVQPLLRMTHANKQETVQRIQDLKPEDCTNLWGGIRDGLKLFSETATVGNVMGLYVLTDGMPNYMNPPQGFVKKLKPILKEIEDNVGVAPTVHTFGFGYGIRSDLMHSIAEAGKGSYCFIPDVGMIGTVFVHAVANLFSTFATDVKLEIESTQSEQANISTPLFLESQPSSVSSTSICLGDLRYGQPRGVILKCKNEADANRQIAAARLCYKIPGESYRQSAVDIRISSTPSSAESPTFAFQKARHQLCDILAELYPRSDIGERHQQTNLDFIQAVRRRLDSLAEDIGKRLAETNSAHATSQNLDLKGILDDINGQIRLALVTSSDQLDCEHAANHAVKHSNCLKRWGRHYLASILHAHTHEVCNSFKDPGPLRYGVDSPQFIKCRNELDASFDSLPAPKPSKKPKPGHARVSGDYGSPGYLPIPVSMSRYNRYDNPCYLGTCTIRTGRNSKTTLERLEVGQDVWTMQGMRRVAAILKTPFAGRAQNSQICDLGQGGLCITPHHPVLQGERWLLPVDCDGVKTKTLEPEATIFSLLLEPSEDPNAHTVEIGGIFCTTLGHGLTQASFVDTHGTTDVRVHRFFGDYDAVLASFRKLSRDNRGRYVCYGVRKDASSGLACDFVGIPDTARMRGRKNLEVTKRYASDARKLTRESRL